MDNKEFADTFDERWDEFVAISAMLIALGYTANRMIGLFSAYLTLEQLKQIRADVQAKMEKVQ